MSHQSSFARALLDPDLPVPPGLSSWNGSDPARRFAVYRNNVARSLIDALADTFPATREALGTAMFERMALSFLRQSLPRSPILADYGAGFPEYLDQIGPVVHQVGYATDLARLEFLRLQAHHAADADPASVEHLARMLTRVEDLPIARVVLHPSVGVLISPYAVVSIWAAHQAEGSSIRRDIDPASPESALIVRVGLEVHVVPILSASADFIRRLAAGQALGPAASAIHAEHEGFDLAGTLALLIRHQAIVHLSISTPETPS